MNQDLQELYNAACDDLLYGIGVTQGADTGREGQAIPTIAITYPHWSRQQLELVRGTFADGLTITANEAAGRTCNIYLGTRQLVTIRLQRGGETDLLRGPAWDARLEGVEQEAVSMFELGRRVFGGFLLVMQTSQWEFTTGVDEIRGGATVGPIVARTTAIPPSECSP